MCKLAGVIGKNIDAKDFLFLAELITFNEDACGYFNGEEVFKAPITFKGLLITAKKFEFLDRIVPKDCSILLLHARNATHGSALQNENNHPLEGKDWIIAHNGIIDNYAEFTSPSGVDSKAILKLLDAGKDIRDSFKKLERLKGSISIWAYNKKIKKLFLYTNTGNLVWWKKDNKFYFATSLIVKGDVNPIKTDIVYTVSENLKLKEVTKIDVPISEWRGVYYWGENYFPDRRGYIPQSDKSIIRELKKKGYEFEEVISNPISPLYRVKKTADPSLVEEGELIDSEVLKMLLL